MTTFIMTGKYSSESVKQISGERTVKANQIVQQCGGSIARAYATLGATDLLLIAEFPGVREAMRASVALQEALGISFATTPALPVEDFDKLIV
ncbi:MAG: GYD domain-containing protein [Thermodesulfobacteriota bacterium]